MAGPLLAIPIIAGGIGLAGNIFGQVKAGQASKKADNFLMQRRNDLAAQFNKDYYSNYLDSDAARAGLSQIRKNVDRMGRISANKAVAGGATPETVIATQGKIQDSYQDALNNLLTVGERKKQFDKQMYNSMAFNLDNQQMANYQQKIASWNQFGENIGGAANSVMNAWAGGAFTK